MKKTIIILIVFLLGISKSFACSCDTISFTEATKWADEIFYGRLIQIREVETYQEADDRPQTRIWAALFEVEKKWKGSNDKYVEVFQSNTSCDFYFDFPSQPYIVYAKYGELIDWDSAKSHKGLGTWLCARNADVSTYNFWTEYGFDDRDKLDRKYPDQIELSGFNIDWDFVLVGLLIFLLGLVIGRIINKRNANNGYKA
ncbi:MAG: hypothetical protein MK105_16190 [Crocinitomicaceae bacterium]|nr:hypothetical protein [Crocinitomicaceae bacterium]